MPYLQNLHNVASVRSQHKWWTLFNFKLKEDALSALAALKDFRFEGTSIQVKPKIGNYSNLINLLFPQGEMSQLGKFTFYVSLAEMSMFVFTSHS